MKTAQRLSPNNLRTISDTAFISTIYTRYKKHGRHDLPWRVPTLSIRKDKTIDPYKILVSEIMLQQTQVDRVIPKYKDFVKRFPTAKALAAAPLADVLALWSGLGYNRRARFLKSAAEAIINEHKGVFPKEKKEMLRLPGIGPYTAGAVRAFAFNLPDVFLETNIRSVYIHFFFSGSSLVNDRELMPIIERTLDKKHPRQWYSALMDYGTYLKMNITNPTRRSTTYKRQSPFAGSLRQTRGKILKYMIKNRFLSQKNMSYIEQDQDRISKAIGSLLKDGLIKKTDKGYRLAQ